MPSSYSPLKIQLMETGENSGTWGEITNTNLGTALEEAIVGNADILFSGSDVQLTLTNTNNTQPARHLRLNLYGSSGGARVLEVPAIEKMYLINNGLADTVTVKNATGTGVAVPGGKAMVVYNDGTNVSEVTTHAGSLSAGNLAVSGTLSAGTFSTTNLTVTGTLTPPSSTGTGDFVLATSPSLTGNPTAPTQLTADNSTRLATTAYVTAKVQAATSGLSDPGTNGVVVRTSLGVTTTRAIASGTGITVTNGDGVSGNPTISINNSQVVTSVNGISPTNGNVTITTSGGLPDPGATGFVVRTALNTTAARTFVPGSGISIANSTGAPGNPTITNTGVLSVNGQTGNVTVSTGGVSAVDGATGAVVLANLASFTRSLATNGYQKLPGGLMMQWGYAAISSSTTSVTFSPSFGTCYNVQITPYLNGAPSGGFGTTSGLNAAFSNTGFTATTPTAHTGFYWLAIGFL